jgi:phytoene/squalene synthetase
MSLDACAGIVQKGDPDRFQALMAAPLAARKILLPLYACNVEVARAPWASAESMIAEMRLQWWWDALEEIATGAQVRAHEVTTPLAEVLDPEGARILQRNTDARRRECDREAPADATALRAYAEETSGALIWAATRALGGGSETRALAVGTGQGLASYVLAVPDYLARGMNPLPEMRERDFADLLSRALGQMRGRAGTRAQRIAELSAWRARGILRRALKDPAAVPEGRLEEAPIVRRAGLLWRSLRV